MKMVPTEIGFKAMRGETLPTAEVEALWTSKLRAFRNRILAPKQGQLPVAAAEGEFDARITGGTHRACRGIKCRPPHLDSCSGFFTPLQSRFRSLGVEFICHSARKRTL
jgi:hypothetical protein